MNGALPPAAARGVAWVLLTTAAARLVAMAGLVALARLVAPADFGLLATALAYVTYAETVSDLGVGAALIAWPSRRDDAARVTFVVGVLLAALWTLLTWLLAPAVAGFFRTPQAADVLRVLALGFLLKGLGSTHDALCQKELRFGARLLPEVAQAAVKAGVAVALALFGLGVWSLVAGHLAGLLVWTALLWRLVAWRPRGLWPRDLVGPMLGYGRRVVAVNLLGAVTHHADLVVVGRALGATALGFYQMAYKLPEATIAVVIWGVSRVLFPALARVRHDPRALAAGYLGSLRQLALLTLPAAAALALLADPLVAAAFGPAWSPSVPLLRVLAVFTGLRSLSTPAGDYLKATQRPGLLARLGLLKALLLLPALVVASRSGALAVAGAMLAVTAATLALSLGVAAHLTRTTARDTLGALLPGVAGAAVVAAALGAWLALAAGQPAAVRLLGLPVALGCVALCLPVLSPEAWQALRGGFGDGEVASFFRHNVFVPHTAAERLGRRLLPPALLLGRGSGFAPGGEAARMVARGLGPGGLLWDALPAARAERRLVWRGDDFEDRRRLVVFVFDATGAQPAAVVKLRARSGGGATLKAEHDALARLAGWLPPGLLATLPRLLAYRADEQLEAVALAHLPGRPAYLEMQAALLPDRAVGRHFEAAADWLARFQEATRQGSAPLDEQVAQAVEAAGAAGLARGEREALAERCRPLAGVCLPVVACHGDFWARNLLLDAGGAAAVVDWEHFRFAGSGLADLFHFPLTYGLNHLWSRGRRLSPEQAFSLTFVEPTPVSRAVGRFLRRHCAASALEPALLRPALHLFLASPALRGAGTRPLPWPAFQLALSARGAVLPS